MEAKDGKDAHAVARFADQAGIPRAEVPAGMCVAQIPHKAPLSSALTRLVGAPGGR